MLSTTADQSHHRRRPEGRCLGRIVLFASLVGLLVFSCIELVYPHTTRAATVLALDLAGLVERSDLIVIGRAKARRGRWARHGKAIVTDVEFAVQRALKGKASLGQRIQITRLGGTVEGSEVALTVPGEAIFSLEQSSLVFLRRSGDELRVVGMAQGLMPIRGQGKDAVVLNAKNGPARLRRAPDGTMKSVPRTAREPHRLSDVTADVEQLVARGH